MEIPWSDLIKVIGGSLAALFAIIRLLMSHYFKQQKELEETRKRAFSDKIDFLTKDMDDLKSEVRHDIAELIAQMEIMTRAYRENKELAEKIYLGFGDFLVVIKEKFRKYDEKFELGKVEVKESPAPASPFGSVKVKSE